MPSQRPTAVARPPLFPNLPIAVHSRNPLRPTLRPTTPPIPTKPPQRSGSPLLQRKPAFATRLQESPAHRDSMHHNSSRTQDSANPALRDGPAAPGMLRLALSNTGIGHRSGAGPPDRPASTRTSASTVDGPGMGGFRSPRRSSGVHPFHAAARPCRPRPRPAKERIRDRSTPSAAAASATPNGSPGPAPGCAGLRGDAHVGQGSLKR